MHPALAATAFTVLAGLLPTAFALAPKQDGGPVAVIVAPWQANGDAMRIVAAADGTLVMATRGGDIAIAQSKSADFIDRLYQAGALLVIDAAVVSACMRITAVGSAKAHS